MELTTINGDKVTIEENSGESHDEAIVILAKDEKDGTMAEYYYLAKKHGERGKDWELDRQTLEESPDKKRHYDRMDISLKDGTKKRYYFDITEFFESGESHPSSIEKMSRLELLEFLSELFENTKELQKKSGSDKDIELNKRLEARIKSKLSEKGIPEGKIKNALRILEVGKEKMADERKIAEKEGCSEEEVKARLVKIAKIMGKMLDEDESMKSALPVSSLEARDKFFDENKDITKDDWKEIKNQIKKGFDSTEDFLRYAFYVKILDSRFEINIGDRQIEEIKDRIKDMPVPELSSYGKENCPPLPYPAVLEDLYSAIATIKIIDPSLQLNTKELWRAATEHLKELKTFNKSEDCLNVWILTSLAFNMKITDPAFDIDGVIGDTGWENIRSGFYNERKARGIRVISDFEFAAKLKVLNSKMEIKFNENEWQVMKENLLKARTDKNYYVIDGFVPLAATMKIMATHDTIITENGLQARIAIM